MVATYSPSLPCQRPASAGVFAMAGWEATQQGVVDVGHLSCQTHNMTIRHLFHRNTSTIFYTQDRKESNAGAGDDFPILWGTESIADSLAQSNRKAA